MIFRNEPLLELRRESVRREALDALRALDAKLPLDVPILIGDSVVHGRRFASVDPSSPTRIVAHAHDATAEHVKDAVASAQQGQAAWSRRSAAQRAAALSRAAGILRNRRLELAALAVREAGKPWGEADADVCEAIDFLEYYAQGALALDGGRALLQLPGERNAMRYVARGVTGVIAPWNFPLAIACGMVAAALATGNAVVLKPAEQTPACAQAVVHALHAGGVPLDALHLLPGGDEAGKALVADPHVHTLAFTGSCAVGLQIIEQAAKVLPGQRHIKKVIAEMGGKNAIIVDSDADLDDVVPALLKSAFAFAGQKCSAASRALVHAAIAGELAERMAGAITTLRVGPAADFATDVPPVIDVAAQQKIQRYITSATPLAQAETRDDGFYVPPTLFHDLPAGHEVISEEIFGPVLSLETVQSLEHACDVVEQGAFALTGGLFSRSPRTIEYVSERTPVGNLYVNREITGAMVGRQPFGGGRLSGTGPKAAGPDYVLQFVEARAVTENTVRHGLVV
jgi:RHH-type proline utilization regulon transcriptional repressor/proline dehydrogenase/delta 1-pyrroline-5-carboxylate dehydrogenase